MMNRSKGFYKLISVIIAITMWSYVIITSEPMQTKTIKDVPVNLVNVENLTARHLSISGDSEFVVNVKIRGRRSEVVNTTVEQITVNADLFGYTPGANYVKVTATVPEYLQLMDIDPGNIIVNIEEMVAHSKPVQVVYKGDFKDNTEAGEATTQPEAIEVSGPKSIVDQVVHVRATVNASKVKGSGDSIQVKAEPINAGGEVVSGVTLSSNVVDVTTKLMQTKTVELEVPIVGEVGVAYEVTDMEYPKRITIRGDESVLKDVKKIQANPINISSVTTNMNLPIVPILPEGVEISRASEGISVSIQLKGITEKYFEYSAFEISSENVPDFLSLTVDSPKVQIKIAGNETAINEMNKSDFVPYIDLIDATKNTTVVDVHVRHTKSVTTLEAIPNQINITLSEVE